MHSVYRSKKVLVTGHTGFKGSWLALWLQELGAEVAGYSLPPEPDSHFEALSLKSKNYFANIKDVGSLEAAMTEFKPDLVFHLAAQPLVRESYADPIETYETNVVGSLKVYRAALKAGVGALVSVTTDKVYENREWAWGYREVDRLGGYDPYSSSKACVEIMTSSFRRSYLKGNDLYLATARAGNVIGGGDWAKARLLPDLVRNALAGVPTRIRSPRAVRPWQHVIEPLHGYLLLGERLMNSEAAFCDGFNFGPHPQDALSVLEICQAAQRAWDKIVFETESVPDPLHEAGELRLDISKVQAQLGWAPTWPTAEAVRKTVDWYREKTMSGLVCSLQDLKSFKSQ